MNSDRIKEIQQGTACPDSISVQQALLKVWNECEQEQLRLHNVAKSKQIQDLPDCTRVEVIDQNGRSYVNWKPTNKVRLSMQDDGRTAKIFIDQTND